MQTWSEAAKYYESVSRLTVHFADRMVDLFKQERAKGRFTGQISLLDVATGTGIVPLSFVKHNELDLSVLAVDLSEQMVKIAEQKALEINATNISTKVMDGQNLSLDDDSFDVSTDLFGLIFFPDRPKGFKEMWRVLKPNGMALVGTWKSLKTIDIAQRIAEHYKSSPHPEIEKMLSLSDPDLLKKEMTEAGFNQVTVETITYKWPVADKSQFERVLTHIPVFCHNFDKQQLAKDLPDIIEQVIPNYKTVSSFELIATAHIAYGFK